MGASQVPPSRQATTDRLNPAPPASHAAELISPRQRIKLEKKLKVLTSTPGHSQEEADSVRAQLDPAFAMKLAAQALPKIREDPERKYACPRSLS